MSKFLKKGLIFALLAVMSFSATACGRSSQESNSHENSESSQNSEVILPEISLICDKESLSLNESANLTVTFKNNKSDKFTWSVIDLNDGKDASDYVEIDNNVITYTQASTLSKFIKVVVTLNENKNISDSVNIKIIAPVVPGRVGNLTSELIQEIGKASMNVTGKLNDIYIDKKNDYNSFNNEYNISVSMCENKWSGIWYSDNPETAVADIYNKGTVETMDKNGIKGTTIDKVYINKDNLITKRVVMDSEGFPSVWENQHLWNHLGEFDVNRFKQYVPKEGENLDYEKYIYKLDVEHNSDDAWFSTYLSVSLTPMMMDTFANIALTMKDNKITGFIGSTAPILYGEKEDHSFDAMKYTEVSVTFSEVGSAVVEEPVPYEKPEHSDVLEKAFAEMKAADNYTFNAKRNQTRAPGKDDSEYTPETSSTMSLMTNTEVQKVPGDYTTSKKEDVGIKGLVTKDAIHLKETGKYEYSMEGEDFHIEFMGYKQTSENTYDEFDFDVKDGKGYYKGIEQRNGKVIDVMPKFDLSPNIFEFFDSRSLNGGKKLYTFILRNSAIVRETAKQLSYLWDDAEGSVEGDFVVNVTSDGHLYSVKFYYNILDIYGGNIVTEYMQVGKTEIPEYYFANYEQRVLPATWADTVVDPHGKRENAEVKFNEVYGVNRYKNIPTIQMFRDIFGDKINGPFSNERGEKEDKISYISLNSDFNDCDENGYKIRNYKLMLDKIHEVFTAAGFKKDEANSDTTGGKNGRRNSFVSYTKGEGKDGIQVVFENNNTKNVFIYIYKMGDWTLS